MIDILQHIIVFVIGAAAVVYLTVKVYRIVVSKKDPCSGCNGCELKTAFEQKAKQCGSEDQKDGAGCNCS